MAPPLFAIRRAGVDDIDAIKCLVRDVVYEIYADLVERNGDPPVGDPIRWTGSLLALVDDRIVGVGRRDGGFISDLWVAKSMRNVGVGAALLDALEAQMRGEGVEAARLRVVASNQPARRFYKRAGWREVREYAHERDGHAMIDLEKALD